MEHYRTVYKEAALDEKYYSTTKSLLFFLNRLSLRDRTVGILCTAVELLSKFDNSTKC